MEQIRLMGSLSEDPENIKSGEEEDHSSRWFWNFLGCAKRETNLFYSQQADGIFGVQSGYENFDYRKFPFRGDNNGSSIKAISQRILNSAEYEVNDVLETEIFDEVEQKELEKEDSLENEEESQKSEKSRQDESQNENQINSDEGSNTENQNTKLNKKSSEKKEEKEEISENPLIREFTAKLDDIVKSETVGSRNEFYKSSVTPSVINNLYAQGEISQRSVALCLGYKKGFMRFEDFNSRSLRILNYKRVEKKLINNFGNQKSGKSNSKNNQIFRNLLVKVSQGKEKFEKSLDLTPNQKNILRSLGSSVPRSKNAVEAKRMELLEDLAGEKIIYDPFQEIPFVENNYSSYVYDGNIFFYKCFLILFLYFHSFI